MRVIVTGGRGYADRLRVYTELNISGATTVIHGCARGADSLAADWCEQHGVQQERYPADWDAIGRGAGLARNREMAKAGADLCIAFPGGTGTAHMAAQAAKAGIPVRFVK